MHICLIVVGLKFHLVLVTSAYYCWSITHLLVSVHQLIITLNLCFLKIIFSQTTSEISNVEKNNRFSLKIFYGSKTVFEIIKSDEQKCIKIAIVLNQSDLIILFAEFLSPFSFGFIRFFCFSLNRLQKVFLKENVFLMHLCLFLKLFLKQLCSRFILAHLRKFFELTNGIKIIHVIFLG